MMLQNQILGIQLDIHNIVILFVFVLFIHTLGFSQKRVQRIYSRDSLCCITMDSTYYPNLCNGNQSINCFISCNSQELSLPFKNINLRIYGRWGQLIYEKKVVKFLSWSGISNKKMIPPGYYQWLITYIEIGGDGIETENLANGNLQVFR